MGQASAFSQIPPGSYCVTVNAQDLEPFQSAEIAVRAREAYEIPGILLRVARSNIEVTVRPTEVVAAEQIRAEERQLVFGVLPNFYTSYIYYAAPLTKRQKYSLVFHEAFDPFGFVGTGIIAGIEQANNRFPGYGQGAEGYGKRYAAAFGDNLIGTYLSRAGSALAFPPGSPLLLPGLGLNQVPPSATHLVSRLSYVATMDVPRRTILSF